MNYYRINSKQQSREQNKNTIWKDNTLPEKHKIWKEKQARYFVKRRRQKKNKKKPNKQTKKNTAQKTKKMNNMDLTKYQKRETKVIASNLYFERSPLRVVETKSMTKWQNLFGTYTSTWHRVNWLEILSVVFHIFVKGFNPGEA